MSILSYIIIKNDKSKIRIIFIIMLINKSKYLSWYCYRKLVVEICDK
jgi:hypothetical protein